MRNKQIWIFGGILGVLLVVLQTLQYRVIVRSIPIEIFGGVIAVLFLGLGL